MTPPEPLERFINSDGEYVIVENQFKDGHRIILAVALHSNTYNPFVVWAEATDLHGDPYRYSGGYHDNLRDAMREFETRTK